jgi:hypothetical protein
MQKLDMAYTGVGKVKKYSETVLSKVNACPKTSVLDSAKSELIDAMQNLGVHSNNIESMKNFGQFANKGLANINDASHIKTNRVEFVSNACWSRINEP